MCVSHCCFPGLIVRPGRHVAWDHAYAQEAKRVPTNSNLESVVIKNRFAPKNTQDG